MSRSERSEFQLIDWIAQQAGPASPDLTLGIGDDCAVLKPITAATIVCKDVLAEGVHFTRETPLNLVGRKALAVNLSDIAAMAAEPVAAFVGLVLPRSMSRAEIERLYTGIFEIAREWKVAIAGGDTNVWDGGLVVSVTMTGKSEKPPVTRSGAKPGDWLFVTGSLGGSLPSGRHLTFTPRIREALAIREVAEIHAMLDISDGIASDLFHMLGQSQVGAKLEAEAIPVHHDVDAMLPFESRLAHALNDGEDFELLLAVSAEDGERMLRNPPQSVQLFHIGEITAGSGVTLVVAGKEQPLPPGGYVHGG